ncbi:penicillin acylase family protein [Phycicoccus sp. Soil802]|uniref:penicillin acylase family protein n=1 Tax=Phycicoccus sp. Soil802 TaxID=1736414 RepID=UPI000702DB69|nr:penicillin acylase family protein [Phycicoccus sp. Soil802]KRF28576.1 penicillin amidase [Phycicoccus sp. Soil802]
MSRAILARRIAVAVAVLLVVVLGIVAVLAVTWVRRPFPTTEGQIQVPGLSGKVSVLRDDRGIPQIYADSSDDLFRAEGFVHAQDRFFEMDLRRHITAGRLSELVGEGGLETDRVIRTLGWRRVAEAELPTLKPETRRYLQAYADGVNAYIKQQGDPAKMSLEYVVLGQKVKDYRVEEWTPADSLAWLKAMAWDLRGDYTAELMRARLAGSMSINQINELYPAYDYNANKPILSGQDWSPLASSSSTSANSAVPATAAKVGAGAAGTKSGAKVKGELAAETAPGAERAYAVVQRALNAVPVTMGRGDGIGSNSWVVGGNRTSTGKPLLANDPHLGVSIPGIWYQVGLHCRSVGSSCPFDVAGYSFSGLPGVVIGHNQSIAWGFTNLGPDVSDFFLEQVRGNTYLRDGKQVPLTMRTETIKIGGGGEQTITVRSTVHGPILSDAIEDVASAGDRPPVNGRPSAGSYEVALQWTGIEVTQTADAIFGLNTAQNFEQFRTAAKDFAVPSQNLLYADTAGNIGYQAPGRIPVRSRYMEAAPGFWIRPGWVSSWDWKGYVPFDEMPHSYNPPEGFIVAANQAVTESGTPFLTTEWDYGYRAQRIRSLVEKDAKITPAMMSQIQGDTRSQFAPTLVKALLKVDLGHDDFTKQAQDLLRSWDFTNPVGASESGAAAAYYNAVWANLLNLTFNDELPKDLRADGGDQWMRAMTVLLTKEGSPWWDDKRTPGVAEGQSEILRKALVAARLQLTKELGKEPSDWQWGQLHQLTLTHQVLGGDDISPHIVTKLFNRGPINMPGGSAIVNANGWDASVGLDDEDSDKAFDVDWAPSMRMVVDLSNLDKSRWVNQTGNSGHTYSPHYSDQTDAWVKNQLYDWPFTEKAVRDAGGDELTLIPGGTTS